MSAAKKTYIVAGVDLADVRNRNEARVAACLNEVLQARGNPAVDTKVLQDAFACALNLLPARYAQSGTIVLREPVRKEDITAAVEQSLHRALSNPKP